MPRSKKGNHDSRFQKVICYFMKGKRVLHRPNAEAGDDDDEDDVELGVEDYSS